VHSAPAVAHTARSPRGLNSYRPRAGNGPGNALCYGRWGL